MREEIWRQLPGWSTIFQVSNRGNARVDPEYAYPTLAKVSRVWRSKTHRFLFQCFDFASDCPTVQQAVYSAFGPDPELCLRPEDEWLDGEEWRPVVGWERHYFVSNLGRVKSVGEPGPNLTIGKVLKPAISKGYQRYRLSRDGNTHRYALGYVLVAEAFIGPRPEGYDINHIDGKRDNPRVENLEYVTRRQNCLHSARVLGNSTGEMNAAAKIKQSDAEEIRRLYATGNFSQESIGRRYGVTQACISRVVLMKNWVSRSPEYKQ